MAPKRRIPKPLRPKEPTARLTDLFSPRPFQSFYNKYTTNGSSKNQTKPKPTTNYNTTTRNTTSRNTNILNVPTKPPTSDYSHNGLFSHLTRDEIFSAPSSSYYASNNLRGVIDHVATFHPRSTSRDTWGAAICGPVLAIEKSIRRRRRLGPSTSTSRKKTALSTFLHRANAALASSPENHNQNDNGNDNDDDDDIKVEPTDSNDRGNERAPRKHDGFPFLQLPLEVRWLVYAHLLIQPKAILTHHDWSLVHASCRSTSDHAILQTNSQVLLEACSVLYEKNVFRALLRSCPPPSRRESLTRISSKYLPLLRNVVLDCPKAHFGGAWQALAAGSVGALVRSGTFLDSFTMAVAPERVEVTMMVVPGVRWSSVTFAEFFREGSDVMAQIRVLRCKVFNVVVRLPGKRRVVVSIGVGTLPVDQIQDNWLTPEGVIVDSRANAVEEVWGELRGLKKRVEEIVDDAEKAVREGKGRFMEDDENLCDGMKLAKRTSRSRQDESAAIENVSGVGILDVDGSQQVETTEPVLDNGNDTVIPKETAPASGN